MTGSLFTLDDIPEPQQDLESQKFKDEAKKRARVKRLGKRFDKAREVIGNLNQGDIIHYVTAGEWSMHELLDHVLKQSGPAVVYTASWSISEDGCRYLLKLVESGAITELKMLFDWRIKVRTPAVLALAKLNCAEVKLSQCHAKVTSILRKKLSCAIVGSANYTNNPRIEAGVIDCSASAAEFHKTWIESAFTTADPFEMRKKE